MKNLFTFVIAAGTFALVSCGSSSETATTAVDTLAAVVDTTVVAPVDSTVNAIVDSAATKVEEVKEEVKK